MGTSSSKEGDLTEEKWNQAEESVERYKKDMLTLINVIKFCAKTQRDSQGVGDSIALEYEWASVIAKAIAVSDDQNESEVWNQVAHAATQIAIHRVNADILSTNLAEYLSNVYRDMAKNSIKLPVTIAIESFGKMIRTVAEAWKTVQKSITDVLVQVEVNKAWDDATRKATREKTETALSACAKARVMSQNALRAGSPDYYWCPPWEVKSQGILTTNTIFIQFSTLLSAHDFLVRSYATGGNDEIVVKIEDTTPFAKIEDIALFSELCQVVYEAKQAVSGLVNHLRTLYDTHMPTKLEIQ
jgi:hypothetical protein